MLGLGVGACAPRAFTVQEPTQAAGLRPAKLKPEERAPLEELLKADPHSRAAARALYLLGLDQAAGGDWKGAGERWNKVLKEHAGSGWDRLAQYMVGEALEALGDPARAFIQYQALLSGPALADLPERARAACQRLIPQLKAEDLKAVLDFPALDEFQAALRLRLVTLDADAGRLDQARVGLQDYILRYPSGPFLEEVAALGKRLEEAGGPVDRWALGLLAPQAGPLAAFGQQLRQGVDLALAEANQGRVDAEKFRLVVADEAGGTAAAVAELARIADQDHVIGVVGPLSSDAAAAAVPLLAAQRVPLLSPSAARGDLADASPYFFRNCLTPEKQAAAMADHALMAMRLTRVASVYPDTAYGQAMARAFAARFTELGGVVAAQVSFSAGTRDFHDELLALGGTDPAEGKNAEQDEKREQLARVEEASTALGRFLLENLQAATDLTPVARPTEKPAAGPTPLPLTSTPRLRVAVFDFAQDASAASLNAARSFADRFARTLGQLPELDVLGPQQTEKAWRDRGWSPDALTPQQLAELGRAVGAAYVLGGGVAEVPAEGLPRELKARWFNVAAQVLDVRKAELVSNRRFQFRKYKAPPPNPLGLQAVYLPAPAEQVVLAVPGLKFFELRVPLLGSDLWDKPALTRYLPELEGARFTTGFWPDSPRGRAADFSKAYKQAYAAKPGLLAAQAYDAAAMMLGALRGGAATRAELRGRLLGLDNYDGVGGRSGFKGRQDATRRPPIIEIKGGQLIQVEE
jgi:ABC-type branched-subunit amino acid transport system substrate-binding protein